MIKCILATILIFSPLYGPSDEEECSIKRVSFASAPPLQQQLYVYDLIRKYQFDTQKRLRLKKPKRKWGHRKGVYSAIAKTKHLQGEYLEIIYNPESFPMHEYMDAALKLLKAKHVGIKLHKKTWKGFERFAESILNNALKNLDFYEVEDEYISYEQVERFHKTLNFALVHVEESANINVLTWKEIWNEKADKRRAPHLKIFF